MSVKSAVGTGHLPALLALRDALAVQVDAAEPREVAAIAKQLRETLAEIAELEKAQPKGSRVDDLANRRKARRSDAEGSVASTGSDG